MNEVLTHSIAFLTGTAIGAAGTYFAEKYTDIRRQKENQRKDEALFAQMVNAMPDLLAEMKADLSQPEYHVWRDFFVVRKGISYGGTENTFHYESDGTNDYLSKVRILEAHGYVADITKKDVPKFRFSERFVEKVRHWNIAQ